MFLTLTDPKRRTGTDQGSTGRGLKSTLPRCVPQVLVIFTLNTGLRRKSNAKKWQEKGKPLHNGKECQAQKQFLDKKTTPASKENQADLESAIHTFKCDQCDPVFKTRNGLKIHQTSYLSNTVFDTELPHWP